jgi:glycosyltransferase involved in cell wall biosynthesis
MQKISICIPTSRFSGKGSHYLKQLFDSIKSQTFKDFQVCISDHSVDDSIFSVCEIYANYFEIKYFKNENNIGNSSANTNSAIEMSDGKIIKTMFQDDFFYSPNALELIYESLSKSDSSWLLCGCNHTNDDVEYYYNEMVPTWNDNLLQGINTISSPSVLAFKNTVLEEFDSKLVMLMDCEYYYRLKKIYNDPVYLNQTLVTNRIHSNQISSKYNSEKDSEQALNKEIQYCLTKHN